MSERDQASKERAYDNASRRNGPRYRRRNYHRLHHFLGCEAGGAARGEFVRSDVGRRSTSNVVFFGGSVDAVMTRVGAMSSGATAFRTGSGAAPESAGAARDGVAAGGVTGSAERGGAGRGAFLSAMRILPYFDLLSPGESRSSAVAAPDGCATAEVGCFDDPAGGFSLNAKWRSTTSSSLSSPRGADPPG